MRYDSHMIEVASRELRNQTRAVLDLVLGGEHVVITVDGRPVAQLEPVSTRTQWMPRRVFLHDVLALQADPGLAADLAELAGETTDDLPFR